MIVEYMGICTFVLFILFYGEALIMHLFVFPFHLYKQITDKLESKKAVAELLKNYDKIN